jgi:hypothetical protein
MPSLPSVKKSRARVALWGAMALSLLALAASGAVWGDGSMHPSHNHRIPKGLRYPSGDDVHQVYRRAPKGKFQPLAAGGRIDTSAVAGYLADLPEMKKAGLTLRHRLATRLRGSRKAGVTRAAQVEPLAFHSFELFYKDRPIARASRGVFLEDGKPTLVRDRNFPAPGADLGPTESTVAFAAARTVALKDALKLYGTIYPGVQPSLSTPTDAAAAPRLEIWLDATQKKGQLTWSFGVLSSDLRHPFLRHYWVAARGVPQIVHFEDQIYYHCCSAAAHTPGAPGRLELGLPRLDGFRLPALADDAPRSAYAEALVQAPTAGRAAFQGTQGVVTGMVWTVSSFRKTESRPLAGVEVTLVRPGPTRKATTDSQGRYAFPGVTGPVQVRATLAGPFAQIVNDQGPGAKVLAVSASGTGTVNLSFTATKEFELSQITAFYGVNQAHEFVKDYLPAKLTKLAKVPTHVNINQTCNAFWQRKTHTLNFFRSQPGGCGNTAYPDVIYHEYGHGVDDELGGILDTGLSEGFGDSLAVLMTRGPVIGTDFFGAGKNLRNASEVHPWPQVKGSGDPHVIGQAYNGFTWQLTRELLKLYKNEDQAFAVAKQLVLGAAALNPRNIPDAVRLSFLVDAKLNPVTGQRSRHFEQLRAAAVSRQIPLPTDLPQLAAK